MPSGVVAPPTFEIMHKWWDQGVFEEIDNDSIGPRLGRQEAYKWRPMLFCIQQASPKKRERMVNHPPSMRCLESGRTGDALPEKEE